MIELFDKNMNLNYKKTSVKCTFIGVNEKTVASLPTLIDKAWPIVWWIAFFPQTNMNLWIICAFLIYRGYEFWGKYNNDLYREINSKFYKQSANFIF